MSLQTNKIYKFANFRLDIRERLLWRDDEPVSLTPKVFDTLQILVENVGRLLEKDELMEKIWQDRFVEESNLNSNIKMLRKALNDNASKPQYIETVRLRGYRFVAEVSEITFEDISTNTTLPSSSAPIEKRSTDFPKFKKILLPIAITLAIGVISLGFWVAGNKNAKIGARVLAASFASQKLSTNGKVLHAVISPDGKNVVYTNGIEGKQSVWVRQLDSGNNVEIIPPSDDFYYGLALSPDGNFLYFVRASKSVARPFDIYRVSIFGGIPQKIIGDAESWISISPDGTKISFVRCFYRDDDFCSLSIADATDGKNERKLVSRQRPFRIGDNRISPDGKTIAFAVGQSETQANEFSLSEVEIESGKERELTTEKFFNIWGLAWLPDRSGLLLTASRIPNKHFRIWQISTASGEAAPLTKDSETYAKLSLDREANLVCNLKCNVPKS